MKVQELSNMPEEDDIILQIERFKMALISRATGNGGLEEKEYVRLRKLVLGIPNIENLLPKFLKLCRSVDDFWAWIKEQSSTYADRRVIISEAMNPILEIIEYENGEGGLEFKKNYEEKQIIGSGGFGLVYLFEHRQLMMPFAVKIFAPSFYEGGEKELERFFQEARMLFKFNHPSIIKVYDAGLMGKRPFIRMEYFKGKNLNQILIDHGIINPSKALDMMEHLVDAMRHAHEDIGIIHRDLKPSNVMAAPPNQFRIIDFGLSIFIENDLHSRLTKTGEATISGYYNAPELVKNPRLIDKRSDIYSLGAIWFTMLTGQPPAGTSLREQLKEVTEINQEYSDCIVDCLTSLERRIRDCNILLSRIKQLKLK
jgi:eukaryotic-like serine/threonine-protein kinase